MARWINDMIQQLKNFDANKSAPHECPQIVWAVLQGDTGVGNAGRELLNLLRREAALQRIAATGADTGILIAAGDHYEFPLCVEMDSARQGCRVREYFGTLGQQLTADLAEIGADFAEAEAQAAPKPATCPCCGKRCE